MKHVLLSRRRPQFASLDSTAINIYIFIDQNDSLSPAFTKCCSNLALTTPYQLLIAWETQLVCALQNCCLLYVLPEPVSHNM